MHETARTRYDILAHIPEDRESLAAYTTQRSCLRLKACEHRQTRVILHLRFSLSLQSPVTPLLSFLHPFQHLQL